MKSLKQFLFESNKNLHESEKDLHKLLDELDLSQEDGVDILSDDLMEEIAELTKFEITLIPSIPELLDCIDSSLFLANGEKWSILNIIVDEDIDEFGYVIPISDRFDSSLKYSDALNNWKKNVGGVKTQIKKYFKNL